MAKKATAIRIDGEILPVLSKRLIDDIQQADIDRKPYLDDLEQNRLLLKSRQPRADKPWLNASELTIQYLKESRNALLAHHIPALLAVTPVYHVEGRGQKSKAMSDELERFFQLQQLRQIRLRAPMEKALQSSFDDGTGIVYVRWRTERRKRPFWKIAQEAVYDELGNMTVQPGDVRPIERLTTIYDGPEVLPIPIEHVGAFPAADANFDLSPGVYCRFTMTGDQILQAVKAGDFNPKAVTELQQKSGDTMTLLTPDDKVRGISSLTAVDLKFHARPYTLTEIYYRYGVKDNEVAEDWLITLHEPSGIVLRAVPSPWWHGRRPLIALRPYPDKWGWLGDSLGDIAGDVQRAKTTLLRLTIDAMAIGINPELLVDSSAGPKVIEEIKKRRGPGGVIPIPGQYINAIKPFSPGYNPNSALALLNELQSEGERATGMSENMYGKALPRQLTATEVENMMQSGLKLIAMQTDRLSEGMNDIGNLIHELNYQFQGNDSLQELWTEANPETELTLYDAMEGQYDISASGTTETSNRAIRAERAKERFGLLSNNPMVMNNPRLAYALYFDTLMETGTRQPERFIGTEEEWIIAVQQQQAAAAAQAAAQQEQQQAETMMKQQAMLMKGGQQ